jgi:hypothetical protein
MAASALVLAHTLAVEAEDLHDEGRWKEAAQVRLPRSARHCPARASALPRRSPGAARPDMPAPHSRPVPTQKLESAAEQYVRATLSTTDVQSLQSLRLLALSHSQRSHELRCRIALRNAHEEATPAPAPAPARAGEWTTSGSPAPADANPPAAGSRTGELGGPLCGSGSGSVNAALSRLGSHLLSTLEALHFGAEELACAELLLPPQLAVSSRISLGGGLLSDSCADAPFRPKAPSLPSPHFSRPPSVLLPPPYLLTHA